MKTLFEIIKNTTEVKKAMAKEIKSGITLEQDNCSPEVIKSFDTLEEAKKALLEYKSSIDELSGSTGKYYSVTEYYVQENIYDDEDEWRDGGDVWEYAPFHIEVVIKPGYDTIGTFDNIEDALEAAANSEDDCFLSFN